MEEIRTLLYPLGLLSAFFFSSRFFLQWIQSEKKQKSLVTKTFWKLSIAGNATLALHALIQLQFPLAVLQGFGAAIALRNLDLMKKNPKGFKRAILHMVALPLLIAMLFLFQSYFFNTYEWMRPPTMPWNGSSAEQASVTWHVIGLLGMVLFSSRFWVQWWRAEKNKKSELTTSFWWISLFGSACSLLYFIRLSDVVNIAGYGVGIIPYLRNLMLTKKSVPNIDSNELFLFAGEQSGDHLGGQLIPHLKKYTLRGVGGKKMESAGMKIFLPMEKFQVMGITSVFLALPRLFLSFRKIKNEILSRPPAAVILIDYPDFNMRLARSLRKKKYPGKIIHYVSPSVWAWRKNRIYALEKNLDLLLTILPFEKEYYKKTSLDVSYVGHPLLKTLASHTYHSHWREKFNIPPNTPLLTIFPGSRHHEIDHNLPLQLESAKDFQDFTLLISCAREDLHEKISTTLKKCSLKATIIPHAYTYDLMRESHIAIATSGTVTLELALHKTPTLVTYRLSPLNYFIGRYLFRISLPISLPNIILKKEIYPEFVHRKLSTKEISTALTTLLKRRNEVQQECGHLAETFQQLDASQEAAHAILTKLKNNRIDRMAFGQAGKQD